MRAILEPPRGPCYAPAALGSRVSPLPEAPRQTDRKEKGDWARAVREAGPYLGIGTTLAVTVALGVFVGYEADARWGTSPAFTLTGAVVGIVLAMYGFFRTVTKRRP